MRAPGPFLIAVLLLATAPFPAGCSRIVDGFLYAPDNSLTEAPGAVGLPYEELRFRAADGTELHGWWVPGTVRGPCVVFLHDREGDISNRLDILRRLHDRLGLGVLLFDYRGYGKSGGRPSEAGLYLDAAAARAQAAALGVDGDGTVLFGRGLGAAVAVAAAAGEAPDALVLEGAFTSADDLLRSRHPLLARLLLGAGAPRFASLDRIGAVSCPVLFLHGERDTVVPIGMAWRLFDATPGPKRFRTIPGAGHEDPAFVGGEAYWEAWTAFLDDLPRRDSADTLLEDEGLP